MEVHEWKSDGNCDRRMRCVDGRCKWTVLTQDSVDKTPENLGAPLFQRREASPQIGLEVQYRNDQFSPEKFLGQLARLIPGKDDDGSDTDPKRLQIV